MSAATLLRFAIRLLIAALSVVLALPAFAQATTTYVAATDGAINSATTCTAPLVRTFSVSTSFTVSDVNIGVYAQHTWRGDMRMTLKSPDGTSVQLVNGNTQSIDGDNFNVLLDDAASQTVNTDGNTTNHSTAAPPPFANTFRPNALLSAFNGKQANGTWQLEICDLYPQQDDGTFRHAELYLTALPTSYADLSLAKNLVGSPPIQGGTASWRLTVTNASASPSTATGVVVRDNLPSGFTFSSASGNGSYNPATGDWTVGSIAPGQSVSMTITGEVTSAAGTSITNTAQITASSVFDPDSTPNNGVTSEDDYASATLVVQSGRAPGQAPVLACTGGTSMFDWDTISGWTAGATSGSYPLAGYGNVNFSLTNDGAYITNATYGGQSPTVTNAFTGGLVPSENSLHVLADQANRTGVVTITVTLPRAFTGVQFSIFDVDFGTNQFADRLVVTGANGATSVTPTLTNGNVNYVSGNQIIGDGAANNDQATGNVVVTFTQAVRTITIQYGNHSTAPANPGQQGIGLHDITVCIPTTTLSVTKVSSLISDPVNGTSNPKAIPGALVEYLITVTNTGPEPADANSVVVWDDGPADAKLCRVTRAGGPLVFGNGTPSSGLSYAFSSLSSTTDGLEFSNNDGASWAYVPSPDGDDCDSAVTDFRVLPSGTFASGGSFSLRVRYQVE